MGTKTVIILILALYFISFCECQENKCSIKETCGACIRDANCVWCNGAFVENDKFQRCELVEKSINSNWCTVENIVNPRSDLQILQSMPLQSSTIVGREVVQIAPQRVKLRLRSGEEYGLNFKYRSAKGYPKIVDGVKITDTSSSNIEVKYFSTCRGTEEQETNECNNLKAGEEVDFKAVIKVLNCPEDNTRKQVFEIKPEALDESLTVEVEMICDCKCEKQGKPNAVECHNSGSLQCGICSCNPGKFGTYCECDGPSSMEFSNCQMSNTSEVCSGLGTCKCNKCTCNERINEDEIIYGEFCECTNYSCKRNSGALCSNNGECDCGTCKCFAGFEGEACQCPSSLDTCLANNGAICSEHGTCTCGVCECDDNYHGQFCEECLSCEGLLCDELKDCVEYEIIDSREDYDSKCNDYNIKIVDKIEEEQNEKEKICRMYNRENCIFLFKYYYTDENDEMVLRIFAEKDHICPESPDFHELPSAILGGILVTGILLLLWKGITKIRAR